MALLQSGPLTSASAGGPASTPIHAPLPPDDCSSSSSISDSSSTPDVDKRSKTAAATADQDADGDIDMADEDKQPQHEHQEQLLHLRVKCNGGNLQPPPPGTGNNGGEYPLQLSPSATVSDLKASVRAVLGPGCRGRYLRLIVRGRLLAPDSAPVTNFGLEEDDVVHAVVAAAGVQGGHQARLAGGVDLSGIGGGGGSGSSGASGRRGRATSGSSRGIGIDAAGIIINNTNNNSNDSDVDGDDDDLEAGRQRRGFDRLRQTGLSRDEIAILRLHFARHIDRFGERRERNRRRLERELQAAAEAASTAEGENGDGTPTPPAPVLVPQQTSQDIRTDRLRLEEEWMAAQGPTSEFRLNLNANAPIVLSALRNRATLGGGFAGSLGTTMIPGGGAETRGAHPRSSIVGTDRDFLWGFLLGFFLGNILFFWALVPSVPHKQRLGLIAGMCFHSMMRNKSDDDVLGDDDSYDD